MRRDRRDGTTGAGPAGARGVASGTDRVEDPPRSYAGAVPANKDRDPVRPAPRGGEERPAHPAMAATLLMVGVVLLLVLLSLASTW